MLGPFTLRGLWHQIRKCRLDATASVGTLFLDRGSSQSDEQRGDADFRRHPLFALEFGSNGRALPYGILEVASRRLSIHIDWSTGDPSPMYGPIWN